MLSGGNQQRTAITDQAQLAGRARPEVHNKQLPPGSRKTFSRLSFSLFRSWRLPCKVLADKTNP